MPKHRWGLIAAAMAALVLAFFTAWEIHWRREGYVPGLNDTKNIFAGTWRRAVDAQPVDAVLVGASRMRFDIDPYVWEDATGKRPLFVGINGASALVILEALAAEPTFRGRVVCDVTPSFFWDGTGAAEYRARDWIKYAKSWSLSQRMSHVIASALQRRLAFLQQDDLSLYALAAQLPPPPNRPGTVGHPPFPPQLATVMPDGKEFMLARLEEDAAFQARVKGVWQASLDMAEPMQATERAASMERAAQAVARIRERGGDVMFVYLPSSGAYRAAENRLWPRNAYWEQLLEVSGARGVHYEDYPELRGFECPDWSHLTRRDAREFTRGLLGLEIF